MNQNQIAFIVTSPMCAVVSEKLGSGSRQCRIQSTRLTNNIIHVWTLYS